MASANDTQVAGDHYKKMKIQTWDFIAQNRIPYLEGCAIKYIVRHIDKGGEADLRKAIHYLEKVIEVKYGQEKANSLRAWAEKSRPENDRLPPQKGAYDGCVVKPPPKLYAYRPSDCPGHWFVGTEAGQTLCTRCGTELVG